MDGNFRKEVIDRSLDDIKVELDEEFDRNFDVNLSLMNRSGPKGSLTTVSAH